MDFLSNILKSLESYLPKTQQQAQPQPQLQQQSVPPDPISSLFRSPMGQTPGRVYAPAPGRPLTAPNQRYSELGGNMTLNPYAGVSPVDNSFSPENSVKPGHIGYYMYGSNQNTPAFIGKDYYVEAPTTPLPDHTGPVMQRFSDSAVLAQPSRLTGPSRNIQRKV